MSPSKKMWIGLIIIVAAVVYLIISSTRAEMSYFLTIEELLKNTEKYEKQSVRISGAVVGDSIDEDLKNGIVRFRIVNIPGDHQEIAEKGGMEKVLSEAVARDDLPGITVIYYGSRPDLLKDAAQAIVTGRYIEDNEFLASELLLKCPSKYETQK